MLEFDGDRLARLLIKPVELGFSHPDGSVKGLPHPAEPAVTGEILDTLVTLSRPYGTRFALRGDLIEVIL